MNRVQCVVTQRLPISERTTELSTYFELSLDTPVSAVRRRRVQRSHGNECGVPIPLSSTHIECEGPPAVLAGQFVCPRANLRLAHVSDCRRPHPHVTVFG